jgi:hypothetical protein
VIGASVEPDDLIGLDVFHDQAALPVFLHLTRVDCESEIVGGNSDVAAGYGIEYHSASIEDECLVGRLLGRGDPELLGRSGAPESDMDEVITRIEIEGR